jgi:hypothetical protein
MLQFFKIGTKAILILGLPLILGIFVADFSAQNSKSKIAGNEAAEEPAIVAVSDSASAKEAAELLLKNITGGKNSTRVLAEAVSSKLLQENPTGPVLVGGIKQLKAPDASEIIQKFLEDGADNFNYADLKPQIADSDLNIIISASAGDLATYIKKFFAIISTLPEERLAQATNIADPGSAVAGLIAIYEKQIADFLALAVPEILVPLHKKQLGLLGANKKIFELIRDYERDPLTSVLALNSLNVVRAESLDVYREIAGVIGENKLEL